MRTCATCSNHLANVPACDGQRYFCSVECVRAWDSSAPLFAVSPLYWAAFTKGHERNKLLLCWDAYSHERVCKEVCRCGCHGKAG